MFDGPARPIEALDGSEIVARNRRNPCAHDDDIEITIRERFGPAATLILSPFCADLLIAQIIKAKHGPDCTAKI